MAGFFEMGGYAAYVWPSYIITFIVLVGLAWTARHAVKRQENALKRLETQAEEAE